MASRKTPTIKVGRSAKTGHFVTVKYAKAHPNTTVVEKIKVPKKK